MNERDRRRLVIRSWWRLVQYPRILLSPGLTVALAWTSLFAASIRGLDYILLPQNAAVLTIVEKAAPLWLWGWSLVLGSFMSGVGWITRRWPLGIFGHAMLAGQTAAFGVGLCWQGAGDLAGTGWRDGVGFIFVQAMVHTMVVIALWREWDRARQP